MKDKRRTRWTDANGNLKDAQRGTWELHALDAAERCGIPAHWLLTNGADIPAGSAEWTERGELDGAWSDLVYELGCRLAGEDHAGNPLRRNMRQVLDHLRLMTLLCEKVGASPECIPWDVYAMRLRVYELKGWPIPAEHRERLEAERADAVASVMDVFENNPWGS